METMNHIYGDNWSTIHSMSIPIDGLSYLSILQFAFKDLVKFKIRIPLDAESITRYLAHYSEKVSKVRKVLKEKTIQIGVISVLLKNRVNNIEGVRIF